ncbi:hypothetical protein SCOCK_970003 [Actinacidiphila cocklensis]|uniref:Uncharacterized protein n=1 Tax=Actinacidiphila cocklensis TaxID=887465 RepID=A0A9W4GWQ3_9ACTN|nr:hypothetical protein SCOCK_970003 [Actinacidiphila cocklensis]
MPLRRGRDQVRAARPGREGLAGHLPEGHPLHPGDRGGPPVGRFAVLRHHRQHGRPDHLPARLEEHRGQHLRRHRRHRLAQRHPAHRRPVTAAAGGTVVPPGPQRLRRGE